MQPTSRHRASSWRHRFIRFAALGLLAACVDDPFSPGGQVPATVHLTLALPASTPAIWMPSGDTLRIQVRRAGRVTPIVDTAIVIGGTISATLPVSLDYAVEQFVATAEVRYGALLLFVGFDAIRLRAGIDTTIALTAQYVGPGAHAASYALGARDTTLQGGDTASLTPVVLDSLGQTIPNVPVRYVVAGPAQVSVDSAGLLAAAPSAPADTARVTGYLPMGLASGLVVRVVPNIVPPPAGERQWVGGAGSTAADSTDWFHPGNWSPAGVPGSGDTVVIDNTNNDPVLAGADTIAALRIAGGQLSVGRGTLVVIGDLRTEGASGGGALTMQYPGDTVRVLGNAVFAGRIGDGMSDGVLLVGGDLDIPDLSGQYGFDARDNHRTVLNGGQPQRLSVDGGNSGAEFGHLDIANTAGSVLIGGEHDIRVAGKLRVTTPVTIDNGNGGNGDVSLEVEDSLIMAAGSRLTVLELSLSGGMAVAGEFAPQPGGSFTVRFDGSDQAIQAGLTYWNVSIGDGNDVRLTGPTIFDGSLAVEGSLDLAGHSLTVTGNLHLHNGDGRLVMQRASDVLEVRGDATFEGDSVPGLMTDGVLRIAGHFQQLRYSNTRHTFRASGNHRTVFNGTARQDLAAEDPLTFGHLEIATTSDTFGIDAENITVARTMRLSTSVAVVETGSEPVLGLDVGDSLITITGSRLEVARLTVRGVVAIGGVLAADLIEFAGTSQVVPPGLPYRSVEVTGSARLTGRTQVAGSLWVHGPQATLTLAGQTLEARTLITGDGFGTPITGGTVVMQQALDSLLIAEDVSLGADATAGSLTAGVLVIGGGVYQSATPAAFQPSGSHRTVLLGAIGAMVNFDHPGSGPGSSFFRHLELRGGGEVYLRSDVTVTGTLSGNSPAALRTAGGSAVSANGADLSQLTLTGVTLAIGDGLARLDSLTFEQQNTAATQLSVVHPGGAFTLNGLRFLATPTSGSYISATDAAPSDGQALTLTLDGSTPADGSAHTATSGGAVVNWTGAGGPGSPFSPLPNMSAARESHRSVLLDNGTILVVGGFATAAETFDPATGQFSTTTGGIALFREGLTATKLYDGRVLITGGGQIFPATTRTAEIYDPATRIFTLTDSLGDAILVCCRGRRYHTATLLPSGDVLVVGGEGVNINQLYRLLTAETWSFISEQFTVRASPARARTRHTATLLPNNRVLIAGGQTNFNDFADTHAEIYDASSGTWSITGSMNNGRNGHTATMLANGLVLVTGGSQQRQNGSGRLASAELYDPATGTFSATGSMVHRRQFHAATLLSDGRVLVTGGLDENDQPLVAAEIYDPATGTFSPAGNSIVARDRHASVLLPNGQVLVTGGQFAGSAAEVFTP